MNIRDRLTSAFKEMLKGNSSPRGIAWGFGIGVYIGFLPFYGLQTILSVIAAYIIPKVNKAALILATQLFLPPVIPFVIAVNYIAGSFLLHGKVSFIKVNSVSDALFYFTPVLTGSLLCGAAAGALSGIAVYLLLKKRGSERRPAGSSE